MPSDQTYPVTVGQLSVWRELAEMPTDQLWEANVLFIWDLPSGHSVDEVWDALGVLAMRHESLRTTYCVDDNGQLRQRVVVDTADDALKAVARGTEDVSRCAEMQQEKRREAFDVTAELPWRVWVLTGADGSPEQVFLVANHIAADGMGGVLMQRDFRAILAGESLAPVSSPRELALSQQDGAGARGLMAAQRYWRRTLESAPHAIPSPSSATLLGVRMHTGIPMPLAHEGATALGISLATLLLAGYYRGIQKVLGESRILVFSVINNRFDPAVANMVTSLTQLVPLIVDFAPDEPFLTMAQKLHWKSFTAMKHGVCDPDVINQLRAEHEAMDSPIDPGFYYNPMLAPPGFPSDDTVVPSSIEWFELQKAGGPDVCLMVEGLTSIELVMRAIRPGLDKEGLTVCLNSIQDALESAVDAASRTPYAVTST